MKYDSVSNHESNFKIEEARKVRPILNYELPLLPELNDMNTISYNYLLTMSISH